MQLGDISHLENHTTCALGHESGRRVIGWGFDETIRRGIARFRDKMSPRPPPPKFVYEFRHVHRFVWVQGAQNLFWLTYCPGDGKRRNSKDGARKLAPKDGKVRLQKTNRKTENELTQPYTHTLIYIYIL